MFYHDYKLDSIAQTKADSIFGGMGQLRKLANSILQGGNLSHIRVLQEQNFLTLEDVTMVTIPNCILFFRMDFEATKKLIEEWEPKKKAPVPNSVLTKMIFSRLQELDKLIQENNLRSLKYPSSYVSLEYPEIHTVRDFNGWMEYNISNSRFGDAIFWWTKFKKMILSKSELNDEVFASAMNLIISERVMNS